MIILCSSCRIPTFLVVGYQEDNQHEAGCIGSSTHLHSDGGMSEEKELRVQVEETQVCNALVKGVSNHFSK